jgi:hypothetical protein
MVTITPNEGLHQFPESFFAALSRRAERQADLTAAALDATGLFGSKPTVLPSGFLLELAAVLELGMWEHQGLRRHLDVDLPSFKDASEALARRASRGQMEFVGPNATTLSDQVLQVWAENFAWESHAYLQTDVVLGEVEEEVFANLLAEYVWNHQAELSNLLDGEDDEE